MVPPLAPFLQATFTQPRRDSVPTVIGHVPADLHELLAGQFRLIGLETRRRMSVAAEPKRDFDCSVRMAPLQGLHTLHFFFHLGYPLDDFDTEPVASCLLCCCAFSPVVV